MITDATERVPPKEKWRATLRRGRSIDNRQLKKDLTGISKFLSLVLRHKPEAIGLTLDEFGWAKIDELLACSEQNGRFISRELLNQVVSINDKQRFAISEDLKRIRASQGHSLPVDLGLKPILPPDVLYHGTAHRFLDSILEHGILKRNREYVHLSPDAATASKVGSRHGPPVIIRIRAGEMHGQGAEFYRSENGVWLTEFVPISYGSIVGFAVVGVSPVFLISIAAVSSKGMGNRQFSPPRKGFSVI